MSRSFQGRVEFVTGNCPNGLAARLHATEPANSLSAISTVPPNAEKSRHARLTSLAIHNLHQNRETFAEQFLSVIRRDVCVNDFVKISVDLAKFKSKKSNSVQFDAPLRPALVGAGTSIIEISS
jgi:hypothetical protein